MFQSPKNLMRAVLDVVDDMLVGEPEAEVEPEVEIVAPHPHHRSVQLRLERRAGTVTRRPADCLSPVRAPAQPPRERVS
jgi:hypothetical protein